MQGCNPLRVSGLGGAIAESLRAPPASPIPGHAILSKNPNGVYRVNKKMNYDVLLVVNYRHDPCKAWYWVLSMSAPTAYVAGQRAKRYALKDNDKTHFPLSSVSVSAVGPLGCYEKFVGKWVGQFIEEAFPERVRS